MNINAEWPVTRSLRNLLNMHVAFSVFHERDSYAEAISGDDAEKWKTAMHEEFTECENSRQKMGIQNQARG